MALYTANCALCIVLLYIFRWKDVFCPLSRNDRKSTLNKKLSNTWTCDKKAEKETLESINFWNRIFPVSWPRQVKHRSPRDYAATVEGGWVREVVLYLPCGEGLVEPEWDRIPAASSCFRSSPLSVSIFFIFCFYFHIVKGPVYTARIRNRQQHLEGPTEASNSK